MNEFTAVKDSGKREEIPTGSVRDTREGKGRYDLLSPFALRRLAKHTENGARKYGDRNWELGQPFSRFFDSATRHLQKWQMGHRDEDHLAAAMWNIACIIHFEETGKWDLDDMPKYVGPQAPTEPLPSPVPPKEPEGPKGKRWGVWVEEGSGWLNTMDTKGDGWCILHQKIYRDSSHPFHVVYWNNYADANRETLRWGSNPQVREITDDMIVSVPQEQ